MVGVAFGLVLASVVGAIVGAGSVVLVIALVVVAAIVDDVDVDGRAVPVAVEVDVAIVVCSAAILLKGNAQEVSSKTARLPIKANNLNVALACNPNLILLFKNVPLFFIIASFIICIDSAISSGRYFVDFLIIPQADC
jgi:hypothetical protein